jgi:hypothetical protein
MYQKKSDLIRIHNVLDLMEKILTIDRTTDHVACTRYRRFSQGWEDLPGVAKEGHTEIGRPVRLTRGWNAMRIRQHRGIQYVLLLSGKERRGTIEERSTLWGGDDTYRFDPARFRDTLEQAAMDAGYSFEVTLVGKSV